MKEYINTYAVGDNMELSKRIDNESCDLVYIDPPYNTGRNFGDYTDKWKSMKDYCDGFLYPRLKECHRILKNSGSIVVHVEPRINHHVRNCLDDIFGENKFLNEIAWKSGGNAKNQKKLGRMHDTIIVYQKSKRSTFNPQYTSYGEEYLSKCKIETSETNGMKGQKYNTTALHNSQPETNPRMNLRYVWNGNFKQWYVSKDRMQELHDNDRLVYNEKGIPRIKRYVSEMDGIPITDLWTDISQIQASEKRDYATQKPVKLLERIIKIFSNEQDIVVDLFAGSGTTGIAAGNLNRRFILFDISSKGRNIFLERLETPPKVWSVAA